MNSISGVRPEMMVLQWHVTERCNLRCSHCYQENYENPEATTAELRSYFFQFRDMVLFFRDGGRNRLRAHINFTGGEPFMRADFLELLAEFRSADWKFSFGILSNGLLLDAKMVLNLKKLGIHYYQISIEGDRVTHDAIRGSGTYDKAVASAKLLVGAGISVSLSFTANRANFRAFPEVARLGYQLGVRKVWADRLIPQGQATDHGHQSLTETESAEFFRILRQSRDEIHAKWLNKTEIALDRALQFLEGEGKPYECTAGRTLLNLMPNGDVYPCRRMPVVVGNLNLDSLLEIYFNHPLLRQLRDLNHVPTGCEPCLFKYKCQGGLKCLSRAITGDPFARDPGCYRLIG